MKKIILVNPRLVVQKNDAMTTGIVYMPVGLATLASLFHAARIDYEVVDIFGLNPSLSRDLGQAWSFGADYDLAFSTVNLNDSIVCIYANQASNHREITGVAQYLKASNPLIECILLENSQAVTAYKILALKNEFLEVGFTKLLSGTPFDQFREFSNEDGNFEQSITPDWDSFPLVNYWSTRLSHGPFTGDRYLPYLSSYGCPWACAFCVVPGTNNRVWKGKSADQVYAELSSLKAKYGVTEFHFEDLNPTVDEHRIIEVANKIKDLNLCWKIVAGTKAETISSFESLRVLAESGLNYISISPESGSPKLRKVIGKRFNDEHCIDLIGWCRKLGIEVQACFVLGMEGEEKSDRKATLSLIRRLSMQRVSEIAIFIVSPIPGSKVFASYGTEVDLENLSFSPIWRKDFSKLHRIRIYWYLNFILIKLIVNPLGILRSIKNFINKEFELKMEMAPFRRNQWKRWTKA